MVAVFVVDNSQRCRFLNAVAETLTGMSSAVAREKPIADVLWPGSPPSFAGSGLGRMLSGGNAGEGEETIVAHDGVPRPMAFRIVPLGATMDEGAVIELIDLSGETGTGRALRESEQRLRLAVEASGIGTWDVNSITGQRRWSPEMIAILGLAADTEADWKLFSARIHPDEREAINDLYNRAYTSPENSSFNAEFRIRRADDGAERWIAVSGRVSFDASGRPLRGIGTVRDIHQRRLSEEALRISEERNRLAIEATDVGTWDFDLVSGEHRWSTPFKRLWGLPADSPSDPNLLRPLVGPMDWDKVAEVWRQATDPSGGGKLAVEYQIQRADDGALRWCAFTGQVFFDQISKKPVRALGIMTDVTERRAVEERQRLILREMNHRVKNSLALVQSIVSQTIRMTADPNLAFERIQSRLMSLARTHDFLNRDNWAGISLRALISGELEPFAGEPRRFALGGGQVLLDSSSMFALGLTFHELGANAVKHGALSVPEGRVDIDWRVTGVDGKQEVEVTWVESGGPPVAKPTSLGFGSRLIEANIRATLGGQVKTAYAKEGLRCTLSFPLRPPIDDKFPEQAVGVGQVVPERSA